MGNDEGIKTESRTHYRLNREGLALAKTRLQELTNELCHSGVYAEVSVNLKITDGIIADVETVKKTVDRIRRRRNGRREPSLKGGGRQGDTPGKAATQSPPSSPSREGETPIRDET